MLPMTVGQPQTETIRSLEPPERSPGQIALQEIVRPLAIAVLLTCLAIALSALLTRIVPEWPSRFFVVLVFLASLESIQAYRILAHRDVGQRDRLRFRAVEWVTLLLVIRFGVYLHLGWDRLIEDAALWTASALTILDYGFGMIAMLVLVFWYTALTLARAIWELEVTPLEHIPPVTDPGYYLRATMPRHGQTDRAARVFLIMAVYLLGGMLLLMFTGMAQFDMSVLQPLPNAKLGALGANALVYFAVGMLLLSQARYTVLRAQWDLQGIAVQGRIGQRWMALAILFLVLIALAAVLLPSNYTVPIFEAVSVAARWLAWFVTQITLLIVFAVAVALRWLMDLLTGQTGPQPSLPTPQPTPLAPEGATGRGTTLAWQIFRSLLFWWALLGIAGYSLLHFVGDRLHLLAWLRRTRLWAWLARLGGRIRAALRGVWLQAERAMRQWRVRAQQRQAQNAALRARRRISLKRLPPRDRARYYYLAALRQTERAGLARPTQLTPNEYQQLLVHSLPEAMQEAEGLTGIFHEARYSAHPIGNEMASRARRLRRRLAQWLEERRRQKSPHDVAGKSPPIDRIST